VLKQNETVTLIDEIIDNASELPQECQDLLLAVAKGMVFTKAVLNKQLESDSGCDETHNNGVSLYKT